MIPYKIVGRTDYRPYVAFFVTVANVAAFAVIVAYAFLGGLPLEEVYRNYALDVCSVFGQPLAETLLDGARSIFLHMSFLHLTSNIIIFYVFGSRIEEHLGRLHFFAFYMLVGFGGHLGQLLFGAGGCPEPQLMVGSSGAISGIIGAFLFLFPTARIKSKIMILKVFKYDVDVPAWMYLIYWFFLQFFYQVGSVAPHINVHWGHVGGFICGLGLIFMLSLFIAPLRTRP